MFFIIFNITIVFWLVSAGFWWCRWFRLVPSFSSYVPFDSLDTRENLWSVARAGLGLALEWRNMAPPSLH